MTTDEIKEIETKWQNKWQKHKVFEPSLNLSKEKYFATVPYPYANSAMHIGHGRGFTTPDIFIRFQRLLGKNVLFPLGYHISGTPVLAVADAIARGDANQIKMTRDAISDSVPDKVDQDKLISTFTKPMNIAKFFMGTIKESFNSVGISIDWSREFSTGDKTYSKFVEWQFKKLNETGILIQGKYPILYSPEDKNAVGEDDIKDGDTDKVSVQEMNYLLFKLKDQSEFIAVATLRPDALFGTTNIWMSETIPLIKVSIQGQIWIVSKDTLIKLNNQFDEVILKEELDPKTLIGKTVITPLINREVLIASATFIDSKHGTGIVYSSPAGAPHDFIALEEAKKKGRLPKTVTAIVTVDTYDKNKTKLTYKGTCPAEDKINKFSVKSSSDIDSLENAKQELYKEEHYGGKLNHLCGEFAGLPIKFAKDKILEKLNSLNLGGILYETSRRAITRSGNDVIVANLDGQWFLDYSKPEIKQKAFDLLDNMTYNPSKMKATQKGYLEWVKLRPCARKRGIGTPLPYDKDWIIESLSDSTIYQMLYLLAKSINQNNLTEDNLVSELFDFLYLSEGTIEEVSKLSSISKDLIQEMKDQVLYWKSFDFRYTAGAHLSNHLSFLIYHYALIFPKDLQPKCVTIGGMLIKDGHKISKSKGNGIPLVRVKEQYGADLYRLYIAVGANYDIEMDFKDEEINQLEKKFERWKELMQDALVKPLPKYEDLTRTNKWLISRFYSKVEEYFEMFNNIRMREAFVAVLYEFLNDINYHERRTSKDETAKVLRFILKDYLKIMAPAVPHICEEFYSKIKSSEDEEFISLAKFDTDLKQYKDQDSEDIENIAQELAATIARIKGTKRIVQLNTIEIIQATNNRFELFGELKKLLTQTNDIKIIFNTLKEKFSNDFNFIQKFVPKTLGSGLTNYLSKSEEKDFLNSILPFLEKEFNCKVKISVDEDRAKSSIPGKPAVLIE